MRYIKTYENINEPQVGDYVIGYSLYFSDKTNNFLKNNIGKIIDSENNAYNNPEYRVQYEDVPDNVVDSVDFYTFVPYEGNRFAKRVYFVKLVKSEINHFSKNKEDLEPYINANKYNL